MHDPLESRPESPEPAPSPAPRGGSSAPASSNAWIAPFTGICAIAACMMNSNSALSLALLTLATGLGLLLAPPKGRIPAFLCWCFVLLIAASSCSLLPATWFGELPDWRRSLLNDWKLELPDTLSPQPALTLGSLATLITAGLWFFLVVGSRMTESTRRLTLRTVTLGIYGIAALALAQKLGWIDLGWPLGHPRSDVDMGPFSNRNHFSSLCAIGCVLGAGMAHDALSQKSRLMVLFALGLLLPFTAIVVNTSRAGLLLFFVGLTLWLTTGSVRKGFFRTLAVSASLVFGAASVLIVFGGGAGARLVDQGVDIAQLGGRVAIYEDTLRLIFKAPFFGFGLGNFDAVFGLNGSLSNNHVRFIHPESDWLWCWFETGLISLIPITLALFWLLFHGFPSSDSQKRKKHQVLDRRLRGVACISFLIAVLHGLGDVPLHSLGYCALALVLAACSVPARKLKTDTSFLNRSLMRLMGLALIGLGVTHVLALDGEPRLANYSSSAIRRNHIQSLTSSGKKQEALEACNQAIQLTPLDWSLYFQRGYLRLQLRQPDADALMDFNRSRALEKWNVAACQEEASLWLKHDPDLAIIPWRDLLQRSTNPGLFDSMLGLSRPHPQLAANVRKLASTPPMLASILLHSEPGPAWETALSDLLSIDPDLSKLDLAQRRQVLSYWQSRGDRDQLVALLESHPDWHSDDWAMLADEYARQTQFEKAWELQRKHAYATSPQQVSSGALLENLERNFALKPKDARLGVDLYFAQKKRGSLDDASRTLNRLLALPDAPPFVKLEQAALFAEAKDFRRAYETMKAALAAKPK